MLNGEIIQAIEAVFPPSYQESWDNTGLQVGSRAVECTGVLVCVDVTPEVVDEAISSGCNLIISHHPLFFKPIRRLTGDTVQQTAAMNAIAAGVSIYSSHTAADSAPGGVSYTMADKLGLKVLRTLSPAHLSLYKLQVMVPVSHAESLRLALFDVGCGEFGYYDSCSYNVDGYGTYRACEGARPFAGAVGEMHTEPETSVSMIVPENMRARAEQVIAQVHPYECPAYEWIKIENTEPSVGLGIVGTLDTPLTPAQLIERVKQAFGSPVVRSSVLEKALDADTPVRRVALCGGAGADLIPDAVRAGAQVYITSDVKYHAFADHAADIFIIDIGHFEAEQCTKQIFYQIISQKFANFAVHKSLVQQNPIQYR